MKKKFFSFCCTPAKYKVDTFFKKIIEKKHNLAMFASSYWAYCHSFFKDIDWRMLFYLSLFICMQGCVNSYLEKSLSRSNSLLFLFSNPFSLSLYVSFSLSFFYSLSLSLPSLFAPFTVLDLCCSLSLLFSHSFWQISSVVKRHLIYVIHSLL